MIEEVLRKANEGDDSRGRTVVLGPGPACMGSNVDSEVLR